MTERFRVIAQKAAYFVGHPSTFLVLVSVSVLWFIGGFVLGFSPTYQLYYNTAVSALTLWLVALLQSSQNTEIRSLHLKLDELLRATGEARNTFIELQGMSEQDMDRLQDELARVRAQAEPEHERAQHS